jgi:hypothetical protein
MFQFGRQLSSAYNTQLIIANPGGNGGMKSIVSRIRGRDLYTRRRRRQTPTMQPRDCYAIVYTSGDWQFLLGTHVLRAVRGCRDDDVWGWWKGRAQAVRWTSASRGHFEIPGRAGRRQRLDSRRRRLSIPTATGGGLRQGWVRVDPGQSPRAPGTAATCVGVRFASPSSGADHVVSPWTVRGALRPRVLSDSPPGSTSIKRHSCKQITGHHSKSRIARSHR